MRIVLDTGAFYRTEALASIRPEQDVVVPSVVVAERRRHLLRDGRPVADFLHGLALSGFEIEPFALDEALRTPYMADSAWRKHARDAMIAAHVREGDVLWTTNPRDFLALGLRAEQVRGV